MSFKVIMFIVLWFSQLFNLGGKNGGQWAIVFGARALKHCQQNKDSCTAPWFHPKAQDPGSQFETRECWRHFWKAWQSFLTQQLSLTALKLGQEWKDEEDMAKWRLTTDLEHVFYQMRRPHIHKCHHHLWGTVKSSSVWIYMHLVSCSLSHYFRNINS